MLVVYFKAKFAYNMFGGIMLVVCSRVDVLWILRHHTGKERLLGKKYVLVQGRTLCDIEGGKCVYIFYPIQSIYRP